MLAQEGQGLPLPGVWPGPQSRGEGGVRGWPAVEITRPEGRGGKAEEPQAEEPQAELQHVQRPGARRGP